jgi:NAD(P)-dependent dehydrogenase (short-subunit alcohol dehydrogenase family)
MRDIGKTVTVITGASSGIGRATALHIAGLGGSLVLAARKAAPLHEVAYLCEERGGLAMAVPTDVTNEQAVLDLAERAARRFGRVDVLVNGAAVSAFARIERVPMETYRRVLETNVIGYVHCIRAVLPYMRDQGSGVIINVSSVLGKLPQPFTTACSMSKFAVDGLAQALRSELADVPDIHVCTVLPPSVDTPLHHHPANFGGHHAEPMSAIHSAEEVAGAVVECILSPRREVQVSAAGPMLTLLKNIAPGLGERLFGRKVREDQFTDDSVAPTGGNLMQPDPHHNTISGGWLTGGESDGSEAPGRG